MHCSTSQHITSHCTHAPPRSPTRGTPLLHSAPLMLPNTKPFSTFFWVFVKFTASYLQYVSTRFVKVYLYCIK